jgi:hypothetical protein
MRHRIHPHGTPPAPTTLRTQYTTAALTVQAEPRARYTREEHNRSLDYLLADLGALRPVAAAPQSSVEPKPDRSARRPEEQGSDAPVVRFASSFRLAKDDTLQAM